MEQLRNITFPRNDYKEVLHLLIVWLGGPVKDFTFKFPGADHHARWMSKVIYILKITLLADQMVVCEKKDVEPEESDDKNKKRKRTKRKKLGGMVITENEKLQMQEMSEFIGLFYAMGFLKSPLAGSAPYNDLSFMSDMSLYKKYNSKIAEACLLSCHRHLWYLTPQLIVFSLADPQVSSSEKEDLAKALFSTPRPPIMKSGKPTFPVIVFPKPHSIPKLSSFVSSESWLLFDLLHMEGAQEWMQTPVKNWQMFAEFRKLEGFISNVSVTNDLAERGIKMTSDFLHLCRDEEQLQALLQGVEEHRDLFPTYTREVFARLNC